MKFNAITPNDGYEYFFGYYDLQPYDKDGRYHLTHRVAFRDHHPSAEDIAEIGYIDLQTKTFVKVAETLAWNFQQGALLVWFESGKSVLFNDFDGEKYVARVVDLSGNELKRFSRPFATVSPDRTKAISINFSRIHDFRKGYGYSNLKDEYFDVNAPETDGIFLCNLTTGESKLLASYADMAKMFAEPPFTDGKLVLNHINFNPSGTGFVFLLRNFPAQGSKWGTLLGAGVLSGKLWKLTNFEVNSHYSFKDDDTLLIYSGLPEWGVYVINVQNGSRSRLNNREVDKDDIHVNYSPDRSFFIGDGYVDKEQKRWIYRYDFATKEAYPLFSVYSEPVNDIDIRCDLHARFSPSGEKISYDTTQNNRREIIEVIWE
ncbi:MAG: hypothetical protein IJX96_00310 [Clostridia bacterium]|nr:hypothetical protein [Clostridia bacterium]